jgi:uncharacterized membrane-anchored protein YitT (DUF2179 family)
VKEGKEGMQTKPVWLDYVMIVAGTLVTALAFNLFIIPHQIAPGGVSGIGALVYYVSNHKIPVGATIIVLNIPLFAASLKLLGGRFGIRTLLATILLSVFIDYIKVPSLSDNALLASVYGGVLIGFGLGLVFRGNATTGGTDLMARLIRHWIPSIGISWVLFVIDSLVVVASGILLGPDRALYALISLFITSKMIDLVLEGLNQSKAFFIITRHTEAIVGRILAEMDRGATLLRGKGAYTGEDRDVILCVLNRVQTTRLKAVVKEEDPDAFVLVADVREAMGEGFKSLE